MTPTIAIILFTAFVGALLLLHGTGSMTEVTTNMMTEYGNLLARVRERAAESDDEDDLEDDDDDEYDD